MMKTLRVLAFLLIAQFMSGCSDTGTDNGDDDAPPGTVWTVRESGSDTDYEAVAAGDSAFLAVGSSTEMSDIGRLSISETGTSWESHSLENVSRITDVIWTGDTFAATWAGSTFTSADGISWQLLAPPPAPSSIMYLASAGTRYVGANMTGGIAWMDDASGWALAAEPWDSSIILFGVTWTGGWFAVVGSMSPNGLDSHAAVALSDDGEEWTIRALDVDGRLMDIVWAFNRFVAVGDNGLVVTSKDGYSWYEQTSGVTKNLYGVCYTGSRCVAVGEDGAVLTSTYGINWTKRDSKTTQDLLDVAYWKGTVVAIGRSVIISSE